MNFTLAPKRRKNLIRDEKIDDLIHECYTIHFKKLYSIAYGILTDENAAMDVVQNVFLEFCERLIVKKKKVPEHVLNYLKVCVKNEAIRMSKGKKRRATVDVEVTHQLSTTFSLTDGPKILDEERVKEILTAKEFNIFILWKQGLRRSEIASQLKLKANNIYQIEYRIRRKLRNYPKK